MIVYTGDGTGVLGGPHRERSGNRLERAFSRLEWSDWTASGAQGAGVDWIDFCENTCAGSPHRAYPIKVEAYRLETMHGELVFSRLRVTYTRGLPMFDNRRVARTHTLTVAYDHGFELG